jgi:hypothetical protein
MYAVFDSLVYYAVQHHHLGKEVRREHSELYTVAGCSDELKAIITPRQNTEN